MTPKVLLVDPSIFTAPYDAALSRGLRDNGLDPVWAARRMRVDEEPELPVEEILPLFYRWTDGPRRSRGAVWKVAKGLEHAWGLHSLHQVATRGDFDVVHFQWATLPFLDAPAMRRIRRRKPVVLTLHDTTPHNGGAVNRLQRDGFERVFEAADRLIVHTAGARDTLVARGVNAGRIDVVPHGPLAPRVQPQKARSGATGRWRVVMFGRVQTYKGVDVLIEALGRLAPEVRDKLEVVVAGEPQIPVEALRARANELGLSPPSLIFRLWRHTEQEMADLLAEADCFVFPYLAIESSGVLFLTFGLGKWLIASALGSFVEVVGEGQGVLVPPGDVGALADALAEGVGRVPTAGDPLQAPGWKEIGAMTIGVYRTAMRAPRPA